MKYALRFACVTGLTVCCFLAFSVVAVAQEGGWLGISIQDLTAGLKEAMDYESDVGVVVNDVEENSPAEKAGIKEGDIIIEYDGKTISNTGNLIRKVRASDPGDEVEIVVLRKGKEETLTVSIGEVSKRRKIFKERKSEKKPQVLKIKEGTHGWLGIHLQDLNDQLGEYFGVSNGQGALITEVIDESPAERAGLQAGDVIVSYGGKDIDNADELVKAVHDTEVGQEVEITVRREKRSRMFRVEIGETPQKYRKPKVELYGIPVPGGHWDIKPFDEHVKPWEFFEEKLGKDKIWRKRAYEDIEKDELIDLKKRLEKLEREIEKLKDRL